MSSATAVAEPFIGDADSVAAAWRALSEGEAERAANYRHWAAEARDDSERARWNAEADKQEQSARWHAGKAREWANG